MKRKLIYRLAGMGLAGLLVFESMDLTAAVAGSTLVLASESEVQEEDVDAERLPSGQEQPESAEETIVQESRQEETTLVDEVSEAETEMEENENTDCREDESEAETTEQESITGDGEESVTYENTMTETNESGIEENAEILDSTSNEVVEGDFIYAVSDTEATIIKYIGSDTELVIPSTLGGYTVTNIGKEAFSGCTSIKKYNF